MEIEKLYQEYLLSDGICIDSRIIKPNQIFFALPGSKVNGNAYAIQALKSGARLAIVEDKVLAESDLNCCFTDSSLLLLQALAKEYRRHLNIPIIGITGSVGKTTTKELITSLLSSTFKVIATEGNLNNHLGVPMTVLSIKKETEIAIIEMGANHIGEIAELCDICQPSHGIITKVGKAHLEGFGSLEGVIIAKSDLYRYLRDHSGTAFINDEDELLMAMSKGFEMNQILVSNTIMSSLVSSDPFLHLNIIYNEKSFDIHTQLPGIYNYENVCLALAVGVYFKIEIEKSIVALDGFKQMSNRSQHINHLSNEYILDAYNANPVSMAAAIQSFHSWKTNKQKILVLGEMKELGETRLKEHQKIIDLVNTYSWHSICLVGSSFSEIGKDKDHLYFKDVTELKSWYDGQIFSNTAFLIKASRGMTLEKMMNSITPGSTH
ncbi:MAG: UDP-N-acetylmuramoyl-tripeptide--D-alanyl-D-alanine ligase [Saprospiraceae bacterium]